MNAVWEATEDFKLHNVIYAVLIIVQNLKKACHQIRTLSEAQVCTILMFVHRHKVSKRSAGQGLRVIFRPSLDLI